MAKRILSIVLALLMTVNVFAISVNATPVSESDYNAKFFLSADKEKPQPKDTVTVTFALQNDYNLGAVNAMIAYDANYYETPGDFKALDTTSNGISTSWTAQELLTVEKQKEAMYPSFYDDTMKAQYKLIKISVMWRLQTASDNGQGFEPTVYTNKTDLASFTLKVKDGAPEDGQGIIWLDPAFQLTETSDLEARGATYVSRREGDLETAVAATYGQTLDFSEAALFKPAEECKHTSASWVVTTDPTCGKDGVESYLCSSCKTVLDTRTVKATGKHTPGDPATCGEPQLCTVCKTELAPATGLHTPGAPATCKDPQICTVCLTELAPVTGIHTPGEAATCTTDQLCTVCLTVLTPKTGHTLGDWTVKTPATCLVAGEQVKICSVCFNEIETAEISALQHDWGEWQTVTSPTNDTPGEKIRYCKREECDAYETEEIPALAADYSKVDEAKGKVPKDLSVYTTASVNALNKALNAVEEGLDASNQEKVDGFAKAIEDAIAGLKLIPETLADYTELDAAIEKWVPTEVNRNTGVYKDDELKALDELVASFDRQLSNSTEDELVIIGYINSLKLAYQNLTKDESKAKIEFSISTDKQYISKDDEITVTVKAKANYPISVINVPVIYDKTAFSVVGTTSNFFTASGPFSEGSYSGTKNKAPTGGFGKTSNNEYWNTTETKAKYGYIVFGYTFNSSINPDNLDFVTPTTEVVLGTFKLKAITSTTSYSGKIMISPEWAKSSANVSGTLYAGREVGSIFGNTESKGQTFASTDATVTINPPCLHSSTTWKVTTDPTCTDDGVESEICDSCKQTINTRPVTKTGHTPGPAATCVDPQLCTVCKAELAPATGEHTPGEAATCTTDQLCTVCQIVLTPKKGHIPGEAATCTTDQLCTECRTVLTPKKGHTPGAAATCTTDQLCTECKTVLQEKLGHNYTVFVENHPATCTARGYDVYKCERCESTKNLNSVNALQHDEDMGNVTTPPTCTTDGVMTYYCTRVGCDCASPENGGTKSLRTETIDKLGHLPSDWQVIEPATCEDSGIKVKVCTRTGCTAELERESIDPLGHDMQLTSKTDPTCTEDGREVYKCSRTGCTASKTETASTKQSLAKLGHDWTNITTAYGYETKTCSRCKIVDKTFVGTHVSGVQFTNSQYAAHTRDTFTLEYTVSPANASDTRVKWTSSNEKTATVDDNGVITAHKPGKAIITCTTVDPTDGSSDNFASSQCEVTVTYKWWQWLIVIFLFGFIWYK